MCKLEELRKDYTDEEIINMVEYDYECVYNKYKILDQLYGNDKDGKFLMVPRFFIYNLRNYLIKVEKDNKLDNILSGEVVKFIKSQERGNRKNRGTYIASGSDIKNWIHYLEIYSNY